MKRYRLIESHQLYEDNVPRKQLTPVAYEMIKRLRAKQFKIDWDKIERETDTEISDEDKLICDNAFSAKVITAWGALNDIRLPFVGGLILLCLGAVLAKVNLIVSIAIGVFVLIAWVIHVLYLKYFEYKHKIAKIDPEVGAKIFDQMQQQGIDYSDIKYEWKMMWERRKFYSKDPVKAWALTIGLTVLIVILMEFTPLRIGLFK